MTQDADRQTENTCLYHQYMGFWRYLQAHPRDCLRNLRKTRRNGCESGRQIKFLQKKKTTIFPPVLTKGWGFSVLIRYTTSKSRSREAESTRFRDRKGRDMRKQNKAKPEYRVAHGSSADHDPDGGRLDEQARHANGGSRQCAGYAGRQSGRQEPHHRHRHAGTAGGHRAGREYSSGDRIL